jgi:isoquinoline 1-oxidoreductase beta subunit
VRVEPISFNRNVREGDLYLGATGIWSTFAGAGASGELMKTLLQAGASARERLRAAAAAHWKVPVKEVEADAGVLTHARSKRQASYGDLAARAATIKLPREPDPKPREQWTLLTKQTLPMVHARSVINGSSVYGIDVRVPKMLYAALLQCPVHGGRLKSYDFDTIKNMPGVRGVAVVDPDEPRRNLKKPASWANTNAQAGIAVVAEHYWQARKALEKLPVTWDFGAGAKVKATQQIYDSPVRATANSGEDLLSDVGDAPRLLDAPGPRHSMPPITHLSATTPRWSRSTAPRASQRAASISGIRRPWCSRRWSSPPKRPAYRRRTSTITSRWSAAASAGG